MLTNFDLTIIIVSGFVTAVVVISVQVVVKWLGPAYGVLAFLPSVSVISCVGLGMTNTHDGVLDVETFQMATLPGTLSSFVAYGVMSVWLFGPDLLPVSVQQDLTSLIVGTDVLAVIFWAPLAICILTLKSCIKGLGHEIEVISSAVFLVICIIWSLYFFFRPSIPMVSRAGVWGTPWYVYAISSSITGVFVSLSITCGKVGYPGLSTFLTNFPMLSLSSLSALAAVDGFDFAQNTTRAILAGATGTATFWFIVSFLVPEYGKLWGNFLAVTFVMIVNATPTFIFYRAAITRNARQKGLPLPESEREKEEEERALLGDISQI